VVKRGVVVKIVLRCMAKDLQANIMAMPHPAIHMRNV
jgi:hypothetical protein